ncbi:LamG domain-containing protein [Candidatus Poribacteria bacterium]|nr:LamG domain-containing protein [Candidatus Poribacteria bacterium]
MRIDMKRSIIMYITVMVLMGACMLSVNADLKDPTLSVYYSFDKEGGTIEDGSPNRNDGKLEGNTDWEEGVFGKAIKLENSVWINLNGPEFENGPVDGFTLAVWVNHTGSGNPQTLLDAIGGGHGSGLYHMEIRPAGFRFFHRDNTNTEVFNINPGPVIEANKWVHFAGTYDSGSGDIKIYVDGEETHAGKGNGKLSDDWSVTAGIGHHKNDRWYIGLLDEYYLFDRALSEDEINEVKDGEFLDVKPAGKLTTTWGNIKAQ